jgi:hypothetical protein
MGAQPTQTQRKRVCIGWGGCCCRRGRQQPGSPDAAAGQLAWQLAWQLAPAASAVLFRSAAVRIPGQQLLGHAQSGVACEDDW